MEQGQAAAGALGLSLSPLDALASQTRTVKLNIERNPQGQAEEDDYFSRATTSSSDGHGDRRPTPLDLGPMPSSYATPSWSPPRTNVTRDDDETSFLDMGSSPPKAIEPAPRSPLGLSGQFRSTQRHQDGHEHQQQHRRGPSGSSGRSKMTFETDSTDYVWPAHDDEPESLTAEAAGPSAPPPTFCAPGLAPPSLTRKASTGHAPQRQTRSARPDTVVRSMIALEEDGPDEVLASPHPVQSGPLLSPASAMFPRAGAGRETSWTSAGSTGQTDSAYPESDGRGYASGVSWTSDPFEYTNYETPKTTQISAFPTPPPTASPPTATMTPSSTYPNPALDTPVQTGNGLPSGSPHPPVSYHRNFSRPTRTSITSMPLPPEPVPKSGLPTPPDSQKGSPEPRQQPPLASQSFPDRQRTGKGPLIWSGSLAFTSAAAHIGASPPPPTTTKAAKSRLSIDSTQSSAGAKRTWPSSPVGTSPGAGLLKSARWGGKKLSFGSSYGRRRGVSESSSTKAGPDWIDLGGGTRSLHDEPPVLAFTGDVGKVREGTFQDEVEQRRREREEAWEKEREAAEKDETERRRREAEETEREVFRGEGYGHTTGAGRAAGSWEGAMAPRSPYEEAYSRDRLAVPAPATPQHDRTESGNTARYSLYSLPPEEQLVYSRAASRLSWGKPLDRGAAGGVGETPSRHARFDVSTPQRSPQPSADLPSSMQKARALQGRNGSIDNGKRTPQESLQLGIEAHERGDLSRSATLFERSARENGGCGAGMIMWGLALRHGWGCSVNQARGFKWLQKAAESVVEDLDKAVEQDRFVATDGGDGEAVVARNELVLAIYEMGQCFMRGWGCKKDKPLGVSYFELAAQLGDPDAQLELGFCYANARGCKRDMRRAARFYRLAAAQGCDIMGNQWIWKPKYSSSPPP